MALYRGKHVVSARDFDRDTLFLLFHYAAGFKRVCQYRENISHLQKVLKKNESPLYFQIIADPSTRTISSFQKAIWLLGGFSETLPRKFSSQYKDESNPSTARNLSFLCDCIIFRNDEDENAAQEMADTIEKYKLPTIIINAGSGSKEHPTQMLLDLFTIYELLPTRFELGQLNYALIGDLSHSRTIHSLLIGLSHFGGTAFLVGPLEKEIPGWLRDEISGKIRIVETDDLLGIASLIDIAYFTRLQGNLGSTLEKDAKRHFPWKYGLTEEFRRLVKPGSYFLHPQPCGPEYDPMVDLVDPRAMHNRQSDNGVPARMALLKMLFPNPKVPA